jgi:hypothetical protein
MAGTTSPRLLAVATLGVVALLIGGTVAPATATGSVAQQDQPETDNTVTRIELAENGSAVWTVRIRTRLDTEHRVEEYKAFQERFRNETDRYLGPFRERMTGVVANAANATGREMRATDFTASTLIQEVPRRWGVVTYEFTWTNFAVRSDGALAVGDVFQGGFFIAANDSLQIAAPPDYEISDIEPVPDEQDGTVVTWVGREDFPDRQPSVEIVTATDQGQLTDGSETGPSSTPTAGVPWWLLGLLLIAFVGVGTAALYRRRAPADGAGTSPEPVASDAERGASRSDSVPSEPPVMTDEEHVLELLESNDGRMRQAEIAEALDWSASKTSRIVSGMDEEGTVEKLRIGRENLVAIDPEDDEPPV